MVRKIRLSENNSRLYKTTFVIPCRINRWVSGDGEYDEYIYPDDSYSYGHKELFEMLFDEATEDWNKEKMAQYFDIPLISIEMIVNDFTVFLVAKTENPLTKKQVNDLKDEIEGQMSDGWGEGFEQHAFYSESEYNWDESYEEKCEYFGQFWWYGDKSYNIEVISENDLVI